MTVLLTCEHAVNSVPAEYIQFFGTAGAVLHSHRGWDPGADIIASALKESLEVPLFKGEVSRLLVELNRSLHHEQLFSEYSQPFTATQKETLLQQFYFPYRRAIEDFLHYSVKPVLHLSIHTFTPVWNGEDRKVDIGILFDPARMFESQMSRQLRAELVSRFETLTVQYNEPYQGIDDGLTTHLRTLFSDEHYAGIEIEVNQKFNTPELARITEGLGSAIRRLQRL